MYHYDIMIMILHQGHLKQLIYYISRDYYQYVIAMWLNECFESESEHEVLISCKRKFYDEVSRTWCIMTQYHHFRMIWDLNDIHVIFYSYEKEQRRLYVHVRVRSNRVGGGCNCKTREHVTSKALEHKPFRRMFKLLKMVVKENILI